MTEENKQPDDVTPENEPNEDAPQAAAEVEESAEAVEQKQEIAAATQAADVLETEDGDTVQPTPDYTPQGEGDKLPEPETALEASVAEAMNQAEAAAQESPAVQTFDSAVSGAMGAISSVADAETTGSHHHLSDTFVAPFFGEVTLPGGIYTGVFVVLGVLTALEVLIAEVFSVSGLKIAALLLIAVAKSMLVIWFYMHLRDENRLFLVVLLLPVLITMLSILYLLGIPTVGYTL